MWFWVTVAMAVVAFSAVCVFHAALHAASPVPDRVSLSESTITWNTVKHATNADNGFISGSLKKKMGVKWSPTSAKSEQVAYQRASD